MLEQRSNNIFSIAGIRVLILLGVIFNFQFSIFNCYSQVHPVHVTTQLAPPYSVYLADYAAPGCEQLRVILLQRDLTQPAYQTFLRMSIEWNGREIIRTIPSYRPSPLTVSPGVPTIISGSDLYHYLDPQNMDFTGYSRETYLRTKALPEGQYRITFTAYDYARPEVAVSQPGSAYLYLAKTEPPLLNMPPNQYIQPAMPVQNVIFSWLPRNISSPNSAGSTEYLLELFEIRPAGYNPREIVSNTRPIFTTQVSQTQYVYNIADPALMAGMRYAWRVRAIDTRGRDAIRNNGYSEVFTFTYGDTGEDAGSDGTDTPSAMPATAEGFRVETVTPRRARATWQASAAADGYRLMYRATSATSPPVLSTGEGAGSVAGAQEGKSVEWQEQETSKDYLELNGLIPGATYEARLQSKLGTRWGGYSGLVSFTMPGLQEIRCGDPYTRPQLSREPLEELKPYSEIDAGGFPVTVLEATGANGRFTGRGYAQVPMLGYVKLRVEFRNIFVNADHYLVDGSIQVITDWENNAVWDADVVTEGGKGTGKVNDGGEQADVTVDFEIPGEDSFSIENGKLKIENEKGEPEYYDIPGSNPATADGTAPSPLEGDGGGSGSSITVKDSAGNLYSVNTITGQATCMGKAAPSSQGGAGGGFDPKTVAPDRATAVFSPAKGSKYAFDAYSSKYAESLLFSEKYEELRTYGSEAYPVPFKLIPAGATDVVQVTITPAALEQGLEMKAIDPDRIIFRTANGTEYMGKMVTGDGVTGGQDNQSKIKNQKSKIVIELTLPAAKANDGYELYALHPAYAANTRGYEYDMLGKLTVLSYSMETPRVTLVAVNGNTIDPSAVKAYLDKIYLPVGINWQVSQAAFDYEIPKDSLDVTGSGMFSRYTPAMKRMNAAFMQRSDYDPATLYIFVLQRASQDNTSGDMPRGCQFGYIFTGAIADARGLPQSEITGRTIAHELGHGMFKLKHTFDSEYRIAQASTENLMDYNWGTDFVKHQWDAIHAPGLVIGMFERDEDGMMAAMYATSSEENVLKFLEIARYASYTGKNYTFSSDAATTFKATNITLSDGNKYDEIFVIVNAKGRLTLQPDQKEENRIRPNTTGYFRYPFFQGSNKIFEILVKGKATADNDKGALYEYLFLEKNKQAYQTQLNWNFTSKQDDLLKRIAAYPGEALTLLDKFQHIIVMEEAKGSKSRDVHILIGRMLSNIGTNANEFYKMMYGSPDRFVDFYNNSSGEGRHALISGITKLFQKCDEFSDIKTVCYLSDVGLHEQASSTNTDRFFDGVFSRLYSKKNEISLDFTSFNYIQFNSKTYRGMKYALSNAILPSVPEELIPIFARVEILEPAGNQVQSTTVPAIVLKYSADESISKAVKEDIKALGSTTMDLVLLTLGVQQLSGAAAVLKSELTAQNVVRLILGAGDLTALGLGKICEYSDDEFCQAYKAYEMYINMGLLTGSILNEFPTIYKSLKDGLENPRIPNEQKGKLEKILTTGDVKLLGEAKIRNIPGLSATENSIVYVEGNRIIDEVTNMFRKERPGAGSILVSDAKFTSALSNKSGLDVGKLPDGLHPLVKDWFENPSINPEELLRRLTHGKCAEPEAVSKWLYEYEQKTKIKLNSINDARDALKGTKSVAFETTTKFSKGNKTITAEIGDIKSACKSCNPFLEYFGVEEIKVNINILIE